MCVAWPAARYQLQALIPLKRLASISTGLTAVCPWRKVSRRLRCRASPRFPGYCCWRRITAANADGTPSAPLSSAVPRRTSITTATAACALASKVRVRGEVIRLFSVTHGSLPALVKVHLTNTSNEPAADTLKLQVLPPGAAKVLGNNPLAYKLQPGERTVEYALELTAATPVSVVNLEIPRTPNNDLLRTALLTLEVVDRSLRACRSRWRRARAPGVGKATAVCHFENAQPVATLRCAVAGDSLAVDAEIADSNIAPTRHPGKAPAWKLRLSARHTDHRPDIPDTATGRRAGGRLQIEPGQDRPHAGFPPAIDAHGNRLPLAGVGAAVPAGHR